MKISFYCFWKECAKKSRDCMGRWSIAWIFLMNLTVVGLLGGCADDVTFEWNQSRTQSKLIGFVDDSLAMAYDYRCWSEITEGWNGSYDEIGDCGHNRLCLYNYQAQKEGPVWCDSLDNKKGEGSFEGQLNDSTVWGGSSDTYFSFWKIKDECKKIKVKEIFESCSIGFYAKKLRVWLNGDFFAMGKSMAFSGDSCQYAILDTNERTITYKRFDKNLKWIEKCDDLRAWGNEIFCIALKSDSLGISLWVDGEEKDVIEHPEWPKSYLEHRVFTLWGDVLEINGTIQKIDYRIKEIVKDPITMIYSRQYGIEFLSVNGERVSY